MIILLAERDPVYRRALQLSLERDGHIVLVADHALDALSLVDQGVECCLVDDRFGTNVVRWLARRAPDCAIIVLTAWPVGGRRAAAILAGAAGYFMKPTTTERTRALLRVLH